MLKGPMSADLHQPPKLFFQPLQYTSWLPSNTNAVAEMESPVAASPKETITTKSPLLSNKCRRK